MKTRYQIQLIGLLKNKFAYPDMKKLVEKQICISRYDNTLQTHEYFKKY